MYKKTVRSGGPRNANFASLTSFRPHRIAPDAHETTIWRGGIALYGHDTPLRRSWNALYDRETPLRRGGIGVDAPAHVEVGKRRRVAIR